MPTSYTTLLGLAKPATGELSGTWGSTVNSYITEYLDSAVAGAQVISGSLTAVTLSTTNGSSLVQAGASASGSSQYAIIRCTGNPAGQLTVTVPATSKVYLVLNSTSTNQSVKIVGAGPTTGVTIAANRAALIAWNGSDFALIATTDITQLSGTLAVANGGTGITSFGTGVATALGQNVTGSGGIVLATSPALTTPNLGTPSAATLTNATGLPIDGGTTGTLPASRGGTGVTSLGTGVATALGQNVTGSGGIVLATSPTLSTPNLGTPSAATLTNATGLPIDGGTTGTLPVNRGGTGVTSSTGSGSVVLSASPALSGSPTAPTQASSTNNTTIATTAFVQAALQALHPVGSIYINATNATNPGSLLGFGTWVAFGAGRVPVGFDSGNALFDSAEETGGSADAIVVSHTHSFSATSSGQSATHTHSGTTDSAGTHTHTANFGNSTGGNNFFFEGRINQVGNITDGINSAGAHTHTFTTGNASGDHTHSVSGTTGSTGSSATNANYQPYITVYMWKRTA